MTELYKSAIEHLGWPVFILVVFLSLRKSLLAILDQIIELLKRANLLRVSHKETILEARAEIVLQTKEPSTEGTEALLGAGTTLAAPTVVQPTALPVDNDNERQAVRDYGKNILSVQLRETAITAYLEKVGFPTVDADTTEILIRQLAAQQCQSIFERTYRLIFGSQVEMLDFINVAGPHAEDTLTFFTTLPSLQTPISIQITNSASGLASF